MPAATAAEASTTAYPQGGTPGPTSSAAVPAGSGPDFVNAAVACGLAPVTGLAMPFVSYGGTSLLATGAMVGILLNVSRHADLSR